MSPITSYRPKSRGTRGSREWTALPPSVREWVNVWSIDARRSAGVDILSLRARFKDWSPLPRRA
jgi:hypothetical protein